MDRAEKMDCRANGGVILTRATTKFQLKMGLTPINKANYLPYLTTSLTSCSNSYNPPSSISPIRTGASQSPCLLPARLKSMNLRSASVHMS